MPTEPSAAVARRLRLSGTVQGVGFRPFVHRLASELGVVGTVQNLLGEVEIVAQAPPQLLEQFVRRLVDCAPPLAHPHVHENCNTAPLEREDFEILPSTALQGAPVSVPPDYFTCEDCLAELRDPGNRRHRYPFINCTQCGPRYTLIRALPYDRANTTMAGFVMCRECRREYFSPLDRRFHAEPSACPACGPQLSFSGGGRDLQGELALERAVELLREGGVLAVKGIGGYHLLCDATNERSVACLRSRKVRPHKPLAVMYPPDVGRLRRDVLLSEEEEALLHGPARPIVLVERRCDATLAPGIAPGLREVGVFLPYSPLHHLLLSDFGGPLVATSANISGEPVLTDAAEVSARLTGVMDGALHHDRPIARPNDDPVVRFMLGRPRTLRLGRGLAPLELELPWRLSRPVLAVGGHLKTTIALAWDARAVISPHIGDMGAVRSEGVFRQVVEELQQLYAVHAEQVVCDAHPNYATSAWAQRCELPVTRILHHHAHASALAGEADPEASMLVFTWDGVGFGDDGTLWGGETLLGRPGQWRRVASLRPFRPPGGISAGRSPWRSATALCWDIGREVPGLGVDPLVRSAWNRGTNCPKTSAMGRLFDGAAALVLGLYETTYEGQAPMLLEAAATEVPPGEYAPLPLNVGRSGILELDWRPLIKRLLDAGPASGRGASAALFHYTLAATIVTVAETLRASTRFDHVGLTGGVFQNALLTGLARDLLVHKGFRVCLAGRIPCNDGGLSFGQIVEIAHRREAVGRV